MKATATGNKSLYETQCGVCRLRGDVSLWDGEVAYHDARPALCPRCLKGRMARTGVSQ